MGTARLNSKNDAMFYSSILLNGNKTAKSPVDQYSQITVQSTLNFKKGDQVWVESEYISSFTSFLYDDVLHSTHYSGWMLEGEIVASL
jgi:hypothetical protein